MRLRAPISLAALATGLVLLSSAPASAQDSNAPAGTPARPMPTPPPYAAQEAPPAAISSPALLYTGVGVGAAGLVTSIAGLILMNSSQASCEDPTKAPCTGFTRRDVGLIMLLVGAPVAAIGTTMGFLGARPSTPATARALPDIRIGMTGGSLHWVF